MQEKTHVVNRVLWNASNVTSQCSLSSASPAKRKEGFGICCPLVYVLAQVLVWFVA
jgi:hypothetical protein